MGICTRDSGVVHGKMIPPQPPNSTLWALVGLTP